MYPFGEFGSVLFDPLPVLRAADPVTTTIGTGQGSQILV
jgi:hypothetical protein